MRRNFELPAFDKEYLDSAELKWETIREGGANWLLLHEFEIPDGYNHPIATAALRIEPGYPDAQIDMVYFAPSLTRTDGRVIGRSNGTQCIDGKSFQRWSRHRTAVNPWRPGVDDVSAHVLLVNHWLTREFSK